MNHVETFFSEVGKIAGTIDVAKIEALANRLAELRTRKGRLFILGVGGSAGNSSHAANDFRKLCQIETYAPVDNVSELTARTNDEGWHSVFAEWLKISQANEKDAILVFSVGGGNKAKNVSMNIVHALDYAKEKGIEIYGVVGRDDGMAHEVGDCVVVVPNVNDAHITPHSEAFQAVIWHCLVSHPVLQEIDTTW